MSDVGTVATSKPGRFRFRPADRLLDRRDFDRVLGGGRRRSSPDLVVVTSVPGLRGRLREPAGSEGSLRSRIGLTVGRKAGSSVERNRFKRRVREWFRQHRHDLETPLDIVVIARRPGVELSLEALSARLARLIPSGRPQTSGMNQENPKE
ncbi:MAG: ribonuclease P protein component [Deltaproteobacteria bacterium]|nr:ribonuclease P protein component [Deltaproteobacteria bacterium]